MNSRLLRCLCGALGCLFVVSASAPDLAAWPHIKKAKSSKESTSKSKEEKTKKNSKNQSKSAQGSSSASSSKKLAVQLNDPTEMDTQLIQITEKSGKSVAVINTYSWIYEVLVNIITSGVSPEEAQQLVLQIVEALRQDPNLTDANIYFLISMALDQIRNATRILDECGKKVLTVSMDGKLIQMKANILENRLDILKEALRNWLQGQIKLANKKGVAYEEECGPLYINLARDVRVKLWSNGGFSGKFALIPIYGKGDLDFGRRAFVDHTGGTPPRDLTPEQKARTRANIEFAKDQIKRLKIKEVDTCLEGNMHGFTKTGQPRISDSMTTKDCLKTLDNWLNALNS